MESERFSTDESGLEEEPAAERQKNEASPRSIKKFERARQHRHIQLLVALICLLACNWDGPQAAAAAAPGTKPPRGYCAPISRAIPSKSRCYDHLIIPANTNPLRGAPLEGSRGRAHPAPAATNTSNASKQEQQQRRPAHHDEEEAEDEMVRGEELVYVRLETWGPSLAELTTRTINERLLVGVFNELLNPNRSHTSPVEEAAAAAAADGRRQEQSSTREQILDGGSFAGADLQSDKCRLSIERLLCRLVYPSCHFRRSDVSALVRPPCREDCFLARDVLCSNLNWPQFAAQLRRAFNSTLMAAIKWPLQLEPAQLEPTRARRAASSPQEMLALSSPAAAAAATTTTTTTTTVNRGANDRGQSPTMDDEDDGSGSQLDSRRHDHDQTFTNSDHDHSAPVSPPPIHFYWPHEHSLESCERLPPLRRPAGAISGRRQLNRGPPSVESGRAKLDGRRGRRRRRRHLQARLGWPVCSSAHLAAALEPLKDQQTSDCLDQKLDAAGINYQGQLNRTSAGLECQPWASQTPHKHTSSQLLFDNMRGAENYCRNPGGLELKPWCYTQDAQIRWQYCNVKPC